MIVTKLKQILFFAEVICRQSPASDLQASASIKSSIDALEIKDSSLKLS